MKGSDYIQKYSGPVVIDTGMFIEFYLQTELGYFIEEYFMQNEKIHEILISYHTLIEIHYVLCRNLTKEDADQLIVDLLQICRIIPSSEIWKEVGECKCKHSISISDCFSLAIGSKYGLPVFFKSEKELVEMINKEDFRFDLFFVDLDSIE